MNGAEIEAAELLAPPRPKLSMIERERISPSPLNPRKHFDEAALQELADSIKTHGIQQPIVVRQHNESRGPLGGNDISYSIVMGERRWRAAALAGMLTVPAIVRTDLDDLRHAELAMEENVRRRDLTVMEEANGYAKLQSLGKTQAEIGAGVGVSQSRIANLLRLRELPADVQQMIEDGWLSTGHGIQLARYKDFPDVCRFVAAKTAERRLSVKNLEEIPLSQFYMTPGGQPFEILNGYGGAKFDWEKVCPSCPFGAYWNKGQNRPLCLNPAHFEMLNKEVTAETDAEAEREAARLSFVAEQRSADAQKRMTQAGTKGERAEAQSEWGAAEAARSALAGGLPTAEGSIVQNYPGNCPAECIAGSCPCAIQAKERYGNRIVPACTDPKRQARLQASQKKEKNAERKTAFDALRARLAGADWSSAMPETQARRLAAITSWDVLRNAKSDAKKTVSESLPHLSVYDKVRGLLKRLGYEVPEQDAYAALASLSPFEQMQITGAVVLQQELMERYDYGDSDAAKSVKTVYFLEPFPAQVTPTEQVMPKETKNVGTSTEPADDAGISNEPRLFPCADCKAKDRGVFYVDANGYEVDKHAQLGDWVCFGCLNNRMKAAQAEQIVCAWCREPLTPGAFESSSLHDLTSGPVRMSSGELSVSGRFFCHLCGPLRRDDGSLSLPEPDDLQEPDVNNEAPLCSCGEPTCLRTCAAPEPWEYDRPDGLIPAGSDAVEVRYDDKWLAGTLVGYDAPPSDLVFVLLTGDSGPSLFGPSAIRPAGKREEAMREEASIA